MVLDSQVIILGGEKKGQIPYLKFHTKLNWKEKSKKLNYKILEENIGDYFRLNVFISITKKKNTTATIKDYI